MSSSFSGDFKRFFGRGLAILLPSIVTLWLLFQVSVFLYNNVAQPINTGIRAAVLWGTPVLVEETDLPTWFQVTDEQIDRRIAREQEEGVLREVETEAELASLRSRTRDDIRADQFRGEWEKHWYLGATGLVVAIVLIYLAGLLLSNYLGRQLYTRLEKLIARIPGFKQVYPHVKQVVDLIFGDSPMKAFSEVVLVQYPREGVWTVGLVTGNSFKAVREAGGGEMVSIFVPTSPTPMTGFVINARRDEVKKLDMTVEQALRFVITAGVLTPESTEENSDAPSLPKPAVKADREGSLVADAESAHESARTPTKTGLSDREAS
ncbi:MAG: DUF502 domain-containing protein [Planctomycetota bacterium]